MCSSERPSSQLQGLLESLVSRQAKVKTILGHAVFTDDPEPTVEVNGKKYTAPHILIATGGRPTVLSDKEVPGECDLHMLVNVTDRYFPK